MQVFSNNAATTLAAELSAGATSMTVTASTGFAALTSPQFELVTIDDGTAREIVKVTARSGGTWTVERAQEGTTAAAWPVETPVEARATAGTFTAFVTGQALMAYNLAGGNAIGADAVSMQPARSNDANVASGAGAVAIGGDTVADQDGAVALGRYSAARSESATAVGNYAGVSTGSDDAVAIGRCFVKSDSPHAVAVGYFAYAANDGALAVGDSAYAEGAGAVGVGKLSEAWASGSVAIGARAQAQDAYSAHLSGLLRHTKSSLLETSDPARNIERTAFFSAPVVTLMTPDVSLAATGTVDLVLPANTQFYVDTIGLIVVSAATPEGAPAISVHDLTSELVTVTAAGARQMWKDIDGNTVTGTITVTVNTALTSGAMSVRVYLSGIAVQV